MSVSGFTVEPAVPEQRLLGENAAMRSVRAQVAKISLTPSNVLITGESGTGKEIVARAIHAASSRHTQAFVPINCGAIPEALLESQLFGHVRGAFTTAVQASPGLFAAADRGEKSLGPGQHHAGPDRRADHRQHQSGSCAGDRGRAVPGRSFLPPER